MSEGNPIQPPKHTQEEVAEIGDRARKGAFGYYGVPAASDMDKATEDMRKAEKENNQVALFSARERYLAAGWETVSELKDETLKEREETGSNTVYSGWGTAIDSLESSLDEFKEKLEEDLAGMNYNPESQEIEE